MLDCSNCLRSYDWTNQCEVPACGIPYKIGVNYFKNTEDNFTNHVNDLKARVLSRCDIQGYNFIKTNANWIHFADKNGKKVLGHSYDLNKNGDCYFYKTLPKYLLWLLRVRQFLNKTWFKLFLKFDYL